MNCKKWFLNCLFILLYCFAKAQDIPSDEIVKSILENQAEYSQDKVALLEQLYQLRNNPIDLNSIEERELKEIIFLNIFQINAIIKHRKESGDFVDILELQVYDCFSESSIKLLSLFTILSNANNINHFHQEILIKTSIDNKDNSNYLGSKENLLWRYRANMNRNIYWGFNFKKSAGESYNSSIFDFQKVGLFAKDISKYITKLAVGSYSIQSGQGVNLWSGFASYKSADILSVIKQGTGIQYYIPNYNINSLYGSAITFTYKNWNLSPFFSKKKIDANLDSLQHNTGFTSIYTMGLYRTESEIAKRKNLDQTIVGGLLDYKISNIILGGSLYYLKWGKPAIIDTNNLYKRYDFQGQTLSSFSTHYYAPLRNFIFFGEYAQNINGGKANLHGLLGSLSPKVVLSLLFRNYEKNYHTFSANPFAESSDYANEKGMYSGIQIKFSSRIELNAFADFFHFPWLKYRVGSPTSGKDYLLQINYLHDAHWKTIIRVQYKEKEVPDINSSLLSSILNQRQSLRFDNTFIVSKNMDTNNRLEIVKSNTEGQNTVYAYLFYQDFDFKKVWKKLSLNVRCAVFDVPNYDARIYALERSVLYDYAMSLFQQQGVRLYANLRYPLYKSINCWFRYAISKYDVSSNNVTEIMLQIQGSFN